MFPGWTREGWSRGWELHPRPADYESAALPLSYLGVSFDCNIRGKKLSNPQLNTTARMDIPARLEVIGECLCDRCRPAARLLSRSGGERSRRSRPAWSRLPQLRDDVVLSVQPALSPS